MRSLSGCELTEDDFLPRVSNDTYEDAENCSVYEYWDVYEDLHREEYEREDK
jgi:hypothetical protein